MPQQAKRVFYLGLVCGLLAGCLLAKPWRVGTYPYWRVLTRDVKLEDTLWGRIEEGRVRGIVRKGSYFAWDSPYVGGEVVLFFGIVREDELRRAVTPTPKSSDQGKAGSR